MSTATVRPGTARLNTAALFPTAAFAVLTIAYVALNAGTPHPDASGADVLAYTTAHHGVIDAGALLILLAGAPLALATALLQRLLQAPPIAVIGGALAAAALTLSALFAWTGARLPATAAPELARSLADMGYMTGGPAFAAGFGLLAVGISIPVLFGRNLPRWVGWFGLVIAAAAFVSGLALVATPFSFLLPVVRFGGLIWLVATAIAAARR